MARLFPLQALVLATAGSVASSAAALSLATLPPGTPQGAPVYRVEACCRLCPRAADPAAYAGSDYAREFRVLREGVDGWLFRSEMDWVTEFPLGDDAVGELRRLAEALRRRGTELVIVYQPPRGLADSDKLNAEDRGRYDRERALANYRALLERLRSRAGVTVVPLDRLLEGPRDYEYFFRRDHHWTPAGAEHTAQRVAETVRALPAFEGVPRKRFVTKRSGMLAKPGTLQKLAGQICHAEYSLQYVSAYTTEAEGGGGGLLDDEAAPQIALIGTSNSDSAGGYNFAGYLRQYFEADVLEQALTGGSFEGALLRYLPSPEFQEHPPRVLVWEMPYQMFPRDERKLRKIMREALPLVDNGCRGRAAVLERSGLLLKPGRNEVLFNGGGRVLSLRGRDYALDLQFSDPAIKDLDASVWYLNGRREDLKLHFNPYVDNGGRFVAALRDDADYANAEFMALTVNLPQTASSSNPLTLDARLCSRAASAPTR